MDPTARRSRSIVCSTEADSDAALTMQMFKQLTGTPALFADVRHYHADLGVWDLCNSGEHATYFAGRSDDPAVNLPRWSSGRRGSTSRPAAPRCTTSPRRAR